LFGGQIGSLSRFVALYAAMYAAYGVASPFLPAFVNERGVAPEQLGLVLAAGTAIRLASAPLAGRIGDLLGALRLVLVTCTALAAVVTLGYMPASGFWPFLTLALLHAAFLAPMTVLGDALSLASSKRERFEYGWVRGTGSVAFIVGLLASGQLVGAYGLAAIIWSQALLLAFATFAAARVPEIGRERSEAPSVGARVLLRIPLFRTMVLVAAMILGSHAMHDAFAMIRWSAAGISPSAASALWSLSVASEVLVFFLIGPALVAQLTPRGAIVLAALASVLRWAVMAQTTDVFALALVQPLHGLTFALLHLACMRLIARVVPHGAEGTAQALYATVGIGAATALLTFISGILYARLGPSGFWIMAALCTAALPLALRLRT
jgi:PPP family 3-phenylpropionic acid transporter